MRGLWFPGNSLSKKTGNVAVLKTDRSHEGIGQRVKAATTSIVDSGIP